MPSRSIRSRLQLLVLGVALPLVGLTGFMIWTDYRSSRMDAEGQTDQLASVVAAAAAQYVQDAIEVGTRLAQHPEIRSLDPELCQRTLRPIADVWPHVPNLIVVRRDRSLVCSVTELPGTLESIADRPWVRQALIDGETRLGYPVRGRITGEAVSVLTVPIAGPSGPLGAVLLPLRISEIQALVERPIPEGWLLTITDTASIVLARSADAEQWILRRLPDPVDPEEMADLSQPAGFNTATGADGMLRLFAYRRVGSAPWVVWAGVPAHLVYAPVRATLFPKVALAGLTLFIVLIFAHRTRGRVDGSLDRLRRQISDAESSPDTTLDEQGPEEIAAVARQYNQVLAARRKAEAEASANASLNELVMLATNDALWDWDLVTDRVTVNERFVELFGPPEAESGHDFWLARVHPSDAAQMEGRIESLHNGGVRSWSAEYRMRRSDGEWAEVLDRCYAMRDDTGKATRVFGAIMDVTETRLAQRTTEKAKQRYRSVLRNAAFGIYIATLDGDVIEANPAFLRIMGVDRDAARKWNELDFYAHPEQREREVDSVLTRNESGPFEAVWRTPDGVLLHLRVFRTRFLDDSGEVALEVIAEDLTERRRLAEQFQQAQKMEAIGQLAGGVAHDFNNRLTVIQGRAQLVRAEVDDPDLLESLDAILESASGAGKLTKELLAVSRKQVYQPKLLDLDEVIRRQHTMLRTLLGESYVLQAEPAGNELPSVLADPGHLQQILMNLLVNARDAQPDGGALSIRTGHRTVTEEDAKEAPGLTPGEYVTLTVSDQGCGIEPDVLERVYEPFFTTKPVGMGTGLGLATVYGLAKQNNGYVWIRSEVGRGTDVELLLPVAQGVPGPAELGEEAAVPSGRGARVLVVEDEPAVRSVVARAMRVFDYEVLEAAGAQEALALPPEEIDSLAALVTDVVMPGMRGTELADRFLELRPDLPVLFMSGYRHDTMVDLSKADRRAFIAKPFTPRALGLALAELLTAPRL